jgi:hypothetical protein
VCCILVVGAQAGALYVERQAISAVQPLLAAALAAEQKQQQQQQPSPSSSAAAASELAERLQRLQVASSSSPAGGGGGSADGEEAAAADRAGSLLGSWAKLYARLQKARASAAPEVRCSADMIAILFLLCGSRSPFSLRDSSTFYPPRHLAQLPLGTLRPPL